MTDPLVGERIAHFELEERLGAGLLGAVYRGRDTLLGRPVAVKVIDTPAAAQRFIVAARMIAAWRHPHIIQIHYASEHDGRFALVMDYLPGQDLARLHADYLADGALLPHSHVLLVGRAVAEALDYAHGRGVVHRDVKPANVLISADDQVVLTDFGLALDIQQGSVGHVRTANPYMAPEQSRSSAAAVPQSDLYALAVMLFELLTGALPFAADSPIELALKHLTEEPPPARAFNPSLPATVDAVFFTALGKEPAERYPSGAALIDALEAALASAPARSLLRAGPAQDEAPPEAAEDGADPLLGRRLDGYQIEELVGVGGMARIYRGRDTRLDRPVAIKVIDHSHQRDPDYLLRFEREAQAIARLDHPNIVHLYYYGESQGRLYMVMQYVAGRDLQSLLAERRGQRQGLAPAELLQIARNIGFALDEAHRSGVIHRDVHPGNILVDGRGRAMLTDFGLALQTAVGTRGEIFGTPRYIAPEQAQSSALAVPQSDLYALGVILYEALTGRVPFDAPQPLAVAMQHMTAAPPSPRALNPAISPALEAVILKALAKQPADRYATGAALAEALAHALGGR
ncbi:MAG TPA: protein kinase [Herpetosiphonaceae bacterium]